MSTNIIDDLTTDHELDRVALSRIRGGFFLGMPLGMSSPTQFTLGDSMQASNIAFNLAASPLKSYSLPSSSSSIFGMMQTVTINQVKAANAIHNAVNPYLGT